MLADLQRFLGLDPALAPPALPLANSRKAARPQGWPMRCSEYRHLLSIAQSRAERCDGLGVGASRGRRGWGHGCRSGVMTDRSTAS